MIDTLWNWFLDLSNELRITVVIAVASSIGAIIYALGKFIAWSIDHLTRKTDVKPSFNITLGQYESRLSERIGEAVRQRDATHAEGRTELEVKIAELRARLADPEKALAKAQETIKSLETALDREGNDIGSNKLTETKAALEVGDFSLADELFAQIEVREALAVKSAARAVFARGEIAEQEVRWHDAATHYQKAARLDPSFSTLDKAQEFTRSSGDYAAAMTLGSPLISAAVEEFGNESSEYGSALNNHALLLQAKGELGGAEPLFGKQEKSPAKQRARIIRIMPQPSITSQCCCIPKVI